MKNDWY